MAEQHTPLPLKTPKSMSVSITGRCNLRCEYCFYANEMVALSDLPTEAWLKFFQQAGDLGVLRVTLTGGEVFTRPDLFELIDGVISNRMRYSLLSNGTLITEKVLEKFEIGKRRLRLDYIQISIDGSSADVHDLSRPNSFKRAIRGLTLLKEAGFPVMVRITINRHNMHDLENTVVYLLDELGLPHIGTNSSMSLGAGCDNQADIALSRVEKAQVAEVLQGLEARYPGRIEASSGPQVMAKMFGQMEDARVSGEKLGWMGNLTACGCIFDKLDVLHDGSLVPCHLLPQIVLGNFQTDDIGDIWLNHQRLNNMRRRQVIPLASVPGCTGCEWNTVCNGGCPAVSVPVPDDMIYVNPANCYKQFIKETGIHYGSHR